MTSACEKENLNTPSGQMEPGLGHPDIKAAEFAAKTALPSLLPSPLGILRLLRAFIR
jgi:hypothetical protein